MSQVNGQGETFDAIVVGAGFAGLQQLYFLRKQGFKVRVIESAPDVGGTWYWNRYPGARCDIESMQYSYLFSDEIQQEWKWSELYSSQPEILRYINYVADKLDLRGDIDFNTKVTEARYQQENVQWTVLTNTGRKITSKYLIMATGCLSTPRVPDIKGKEKFQGETLQTSNWPHKKVDFTGKRVGVIGTGSTGIQAIPEIALEASMVTVFQRTPNYSIPARNGPITPEYDADWKKNYSQRRAFAKTLPLATSSPYMNEATAGSVSKEEQKQVYEEYWNRGNVGFVYSFSDIYFNMEANATTSEFVREKIREVVKDPVKAEILVPKDYPLGCKRICSDSNYFETYNRSNVDLVDLRTSPIVEFTATGIQTTTNHIDLDIVVFATGFDGITGALTSIDIYNTSGVTLRDLWKEGPSTYFGLMIAGLPNFFTITGPGSTSVLSNMMIPIDHDVNWITNCLVYLRENQVESIEAPEAAQVGWTGFVRAVGDFTIFTKGNSWYLGSNIEGKARAFIPFAGGFPAFAQKVAEASVDGYKGFTLTKK